MGLLECLCAGLGKLFPLTLYLMAINSLGVHVSAVAHQQFQLAIVHGGRIDADERVPQLIETDGRIDPVGCLVALPAAV